MFTITFSHFIDFTLPNSQLTKCYLLVLVFWKRLVTDRLWEDENIYNYSKSVLQTSIFLTKWIPKTQQYYLLYLILWSYHLAKIKVNNIETFQINTLIGTWTSAPVIKQNNQLIITITTLQLTRQPVSI